MIVLDCAQGSEEWHKARAGIATASEFNKIYTATGKKSTQADGYCNTLLAEWLSGGPTESFESDWMRRGKEVETDARAFYSFQADADVQEIGFCYADEKRLYGASPDGLVGDDGGLELKCPKASTHVAYLLNQKMPTEYVVQVQGQMLVTGRKWTDFLSYCPGLPPFLLRVERDNRFIMSLRSALDEFLGRMLAKREALIAKGYAPPKGENNERAA